MSQHDNGDCDMISQHGKTGDNIRATSDVGLGEGRLWWRLVDMWFRAFLVLGESLV